MGCPLRNKSLRDQNTNIPDVKETAVRRTAHPEELLTGRAERLPSDKQVGIELQGPPETKL